jgi:hypothetical protein
MSHDESQQKKVVRHLNFVGSGTRPARSLETLNLKYDVLLADHREQDGRKEDTGCIFYRPGCPCGVPF